MMVVFYLDGPGWQGTTLPSGGMEAHMAWAKSYRDQGAKHVFITPYEPSDMPFQEAVNRAAGRGRWN